METKELRSLMEAANQVAHQGLPAPKQKELSKGETIPYIPGKEPKQGEKDLGWKGARGYLPDGVEESSLDAALEYFNGYFGGELNEDVSDDDIMEAVYDLIDLTETVLEAIGLDEKRGTQAQSRAADVLLRQSDRVEKHFGDRNTAPFASTATAQSTSKEKRDSARMHKDISDRQWKARGNDPPRAKTQARRQAVIDRGVISGSAKDKRIADFARQHNKKDAATEAKFQLVRDRARSAEQAKDKDDRAFTDKLKGELAQQRKDAKKGAQVQVIGLGNPYAQS